MSIKNEKYVCTLSPEILEKAKQELNEDPARRSADIEALRQWQLKQPHIHGRTDDEFLLRFLRSCKFSIERAKEKLDNFYTLKGAMPQWYANRSFDDPIMMEMLRAGVAVPLGYDNHGRRLVVGKMGEINPSRHKADHYMQFNSLMGEYMLLDEQTTICGIVSINDLGKMSGAHATMFSPSFSKKMMMAFQDCMPMRMKGIHYYNVPSFFEAAFAVVKVFMKKKFIERLNFHGNNLESLHAAIPPEYLPKEYGGTAGCLQDYIALSNINMSIKHEKYVCTLSPELLERAKKELNEDPARRAADIEALRQWQLKQPHIHGRTDDEFLLRFLRNCKFSIERAKEKLDNYYTLKGAMPQWYANRSIDNPIMLELLRAGIAVPMGYDQLGRRLMLGKMGAIDPSKIKPDHIMQFNSLIADYMMLDEQSIICGMVSINDLGKMTGAHATMFSPSFSKKMMMAFQDCLPMRMKGMHYYNVPTFFDAVFSVVKVFMKKKFIERLNFHGNKLESLHAAIPPEYLPKEYGGTAGCVQDYIDKTEKELRALKDYLKVEEEFKADESKRLGKSKTYDDLLGTEGTFRKLEID